MKTPSIHATCFAVESHGILLRGASGAGKSRIALHFIETAVEKQRFVRLVGDDRIHLEAIGGTLIASVPAEIAGLIERRNLKERHLGIEKIAFLPSSRLSLIVDILPAGALSRERHHDAGWIEMQGIRLKYLAVPDDFAPAVARIEAALPFL